MCGALAWIVCPRHKLEHPCLRGLMEEGYGWRLCGICDGHVVKCDFGQPLPILLHMSWRRGSPQTRRPFGSWPWRHERAVTGKAVTAVAVVCCRVVERVPGSYFGAM